MRNTGQKRLPGNTDTKAKRTTRECRVHAYVDVPISATANCKGHAEKSNFVPSAVRHIDLGDLPGCGTRSTTGLYRSTLMLTSRRSRLKVGHWPLAVCHDAGRADF